MSARWWAILGVELLVGLVMLAGYQAWIQPGAPRSQQAAAKQAAPAAAVIPEPAPKPTPLEAPRPAAAPVPAPPVATPKPARKAAPLTVEALIAQGQAALNARDWATALKALDEARSRAPANPDLGYLRGLALENLGQPGAAIDAFRSCTSGPYVQIAANHVKTLAGGLRK